MKKILIIILTTFLFSTLTSCSTMVTVTPTLEESSTPTTDYPQGRTLNESDDYFITNNDYLFETAKEKGLQPKLGRDFTFDFFIDSVLMTEESIAQKIENKQKQYEGVTLTYQGDTNCISDITAAIPGNIIDYYSTDGIRAGYIRNSDTIVSIRKSCKCGASDTNPTILTENSNQYLKQLKGENALENYVIVTPDDFCYKLYDIIYSKLENGYPTGNFITMEFCECGKVIEYNEYYNALYKTATEKLTAERVDYAAAMIKEKVNSLSLENVRFSQPFIRINPKGEYYVALEVTFEVSDSEQDTAVVYFKY